MGRYEVTDPAGKRYEITAPDGATQEQVLSYAQKQFATPSKPTLGETIAGLPITRLAVGAASPLIAAGQLGANIGDKIVEATGGQPVVGKAINKGLTDYEAMKKRGMEAAGTQGMDWMGLLGSLVPAGKVAGAVTKALPAATGVAGKIGVGAATGAGVAAATPVTQGE